MGVVGGARPHTGAIQPLRNVVEVKDGKLLLECGHELVYEECRSTKQRRCQTCPSSFGQLLDGAAEARKRKNDYERKRRRLARRAAAEESTG